MPRRGENIRKRKDGRWEGRYIREYTTNGRATYHSVYGKTYLEVKKKLSEAQKQCSDYILSKNRDIAYREILYLWLENNRIKLKEPTYAKYSQLIERHIAPSVGNITVQNIDAAYINRILYEKSVCGRRDGKGGLSPNYVRSIAFVMKASLTYAVQNNYCIPLKGSVLLPTNRKKQLNILTVPEQTMLENSCLKNTSDKELGILFSLYTGLRIGEVCGLKWEDIDYENNTIHICRTVERIPNTDFTISSGKTKLVLLDTKSISSDRIIPIPSKLFSLLQKRGSDFIIKGQVHGYTDPRALQYFFSKKLRECNMNYVNYHTLRHTFATRCVESGMDIKSLSEILGHASVNITLGTYVHSSIEYKRKQLESMSTICSQK